MPTIEQLQQLSMQLRMPSGEAGLRVADMMASSNWPMIQHSIEHLALDHQQQILELGHASASHVAYLLGQKTGLFYQGLEISALMQQQAQRLNQTAIQNQQADFQLYDGLQLNFEPQRFDRILSINTLYFWSEPQRLLQALYSVAKAGCIFNLCFAEKSFMQSLPFSQFDFQLYTLEQALQMVAQSQWQLLQHYHGQDRVQSKLGDWVDRQFITLSLHKPIPAIDA
jgi:SAM-dependent methyltransferase